MWEVFEVIGEAGGRGRGLTSRIHDRGPFINRVAEFASMKAAAAAAGQGTLPGCGDLWASRYWQVSLVS